MGSCADTCHSTHQKLPGSAQYGLAPDTKRLAETQSQQRISSFILDFSMVHCASSITFRAQFGVSPETASQLLIAEATLYEGHAKADLRDIFAGSTPALRLGACFRW